MKTLKELSVGRSTNIQLIRFIAACMVVLSHAFGLGNGTLDALQRITSEQISLGRLAVDIFFILSGFYCTKSILRISNTKEYYKSRIKRIFPPLIVVVVACVFILGPIATNLSVVDYFLNKKTYLYLLNALLLPVHNLPGVFENSLYNTAVNGALWTLSVEFVCYVALWILFKLKLLNKRKIIISIPILGCFFVGIYMTSSILGVSILKAMISPMFCFYMGIIYFLFQEKIYFSRKIVTLSVMLIIISSILGVVNYVIPCILPYIMLMLLLGTKQVPEKMGKIGDYSYCIYLVGFPIQQFIISINGGSMSPYLNFILSLPIILVLSVIIHNISEKS